MPGKGLRKTPYITKTPTFDSYKCDCGALLRSKSPSVVEAHRNTPTHKKILTSSVVSPHHLNFRVLPFQSV